MGFVKLDRKFFDHFLWKEDRVFSRSEAWIDLIQSAQIEDFTTIVKGKDINLKRGQFLASRRFLEKRWNWGSTKVTNFLKVLSKNNMINQKQTNGQTIITLVNFEVYNEYQTSKQTKNKPETNQRQTKDKEYKEVFKKQVFKYISLYSEEMLLEFFEYWTEKGENERKMRYQKTTSFDISRRLKTWFKNSEKWKKEKSSAKKEKDNGFKIGRQTQDDIVSNSQGW